ncbi:MAG: hypothetical protein M3340_17235 [Actinomycetota bacterium]|nr:hypothetical protein [Actinomycetota bacterium]
MNLSEHSYPEFAEGQVLTHNDLNRLRDYLASKVAFQNRALFGFGVACGLTGRLAARNFTMAQGFALGQGGRELVLAEGFTLGVDAIRTSVEDVAYDFVDAGAAGLTAVLIPADQQHEAVEDCTEATGCRTQTITHEEGARVRWVKGRFKLGQLASDQVFTIEPLAVKGTTAPAAFDTRREQLAKILEKTNEFGAATIALLRKLKLDGPPGIDLMKVGLLNEVLDSAQEYARCRSYDNRSCLGPEGDPAVALGHLDPDSLVWDCRYRHDFEISPALYSGIRGGRCEDVCRQYVDHIVAILDDWTPPPPPAQNPGPAKDEDVHICSRYQFLSKRCGWRGHKHKKPGRVVVDYARPPKKKPDFPRPDPLEDLDWGRYDTREWVIHPPRDDLEGYDEVVDRDPTDAGLILLGNLYNRKSDTVHDILVKHIEKQGVARAIVRDVHVDDLATQPGFEPGIVAALTDEIMIGHDDAGAVVAFGSKPTTQSLREMPAVTAKADEAVANAGRAVAQAELAIERANGAGTLFGELKDTFAEVKAGFAELRADLPDRGTLDQIKEMPTKFHTLERDVGRQVTTLEGRVNTQERLVERQEAQAKDIGTRVDLVQTRVDTQAVHFSARAADDVRAAKKVNMQLLTTLDTMETAIKKAAPEAERARVETILAEARPALESLRASAERGTTITESQPELAVALDRLAEATRAAGAPAEDVRRVRDATNNLRDVMGRVPR